MLFVSGGIGVGSVSRDRRHFRVQSDGIDGHLAPSAAARARDSGDLLKSVYGSVPPMSMSLRNFLHGLSWSVVTADAKKAGWPCS